MEITGLILAGGKSSRFGSDKALAQKGGRTFLALAYDLLKDVCDRVVISGWDHNEHFDGVVCLADITPSGGPMSGIATAVRQLQAQWLLIIPCDMPLLTKDILLSTINAAQGAPSNNTSSNNTSSNTSPNTSTNTSSNTIPTITINTPTTETIVWQWPDGKVQPFPMLLNREEALKAIDVLGHKGGMSVKALLDHIPYKTIPITSEKIRLFSNINTKSEFENLKL